MWMFGGNNYLGGIRVSAMEVCSTELDVMKNACLGLVL